MLPCRRWRCRYLRGADVFATPARGEIKGDAVFVGWLAIIAVSNAGAWRFIEILCGTFGARFRELPAPRVKTLGCYVSPLWGCRLWFASRRTFKLSMGPASRCARPSRTRRVICTTRHRGLRPFLGHPPFSLVDFPIWEHRFARPGIAVCAPRQDAPDQMRGLITNEPEDGTRHRGLRPFLGHPPFVLVDVPARHFPLLAQRC